MQIEGTTFGSITIDGKIYEHDVLIRLSGEVVKRKKKLSKKLYGTSHTLSKDEAKFVFEKGCQQLILGSGQHGNVHLSPEAEVYFAKKGCRVLLQRTPEAINLFNKSRFKKIGLFHVTCWTQAMTATRFLNGNTGSNQNYLRYLAVPAIIDALQHTYNLTYAAHIGFMCPR